MTISFIIPFFNEAKTITELVGQITEELAINNREGEIILVNDGSTDNQLINIQNQIAKIQNKYQKYPIKLINHNRRFGKGRALQTGIEHSAGEVIIFMDGDLQDDPKDLEKFIKKIEAGFDFVNGARVERQDSGLIKLYSKIAGWFLKTFLHSPFTDINCGYKAFKRQILDNFTLYGNNFRFLPLAAFYNGYHVTEVPVVNHPRRFGKSKFGESKLLVGIFDMLTAYFIYKFAESPLHFFGPVGGGMFLVGFLITLILSFERLFFGVMLYRRPLLFLGILLIIVGIQIVMTGIIGELLVYLKKRKV